MSIQDLVLDNLQTEQTEPDSFFEEFIREGSSPRIAGSAVALDAVKNYRQQLQNASRETIVIQTAEALLALRGSSSNRNSFDTLLLAIDYQENSTLSSLEKLQSSALEWQEVIQKRIAQQRVDAAIGDMERSIQYLQEIWGDDLADVLVLLTSRKKPTVQRWIRGGNSSWGPASRIRNFARNCYTLREECEWSAEAVKTWMETEQNGKTPLQIASSSVYYRSSDLDEMIKTIYSDFRKEAK